MKKIESIQNKTIKERSKLINKKERDKTKLFLVEGQHMIIEAFRAGVLKELYMLESEENPTTIEPFICTQPVLNKLSHQNSNAKIIGVCQKKEVKPESLNTIMILDKVQDPGNVGTIIRTAHSFGVDQIFLSNDCADIYNPKTIQATQGALFHIPCKQTDILTTIAKLQSDNMKVYAASLHEPYQDLQQIQVPARYAIVVGNEGQGIREEVLLACDMHIKIEMETFESLNVAIASGILLYTMKYMQKND